MSDAGLGLAIRAGLKKDHASDQEFINDLDWRKLVQLVVAECILTIQMDMMRNGSTPENIRSRMHVQKIADRFGVTLPLEYDPYEVGKQIWREGRGISDIWGAVQRDEDMFRAFEGYEDAKREPTSE